MQLRPFKEIIAMSGEKLKAAMAPIRARKVKANAELEMSKLETDILTKETEVEEMLTTSDFSFPCLMEKLDKIALLTRRKEQYEDVLSQLFPTTDATDAAAPVA